MFWKHVLQYARWIWERFDTILALLLPSSLLRTNSRVGKGNSLYPLLLRNGSPISLILYHDPLRMWLNMVHFVI